MTTERPTRVLIDLQGAQGANAHRGIGRFSTQLANAIATARDPNLDVHILLNSAMAESACELRQRFGERLGNDRIHILAGLPGSSYVADPSGARARATGAIRDELIRAVAPDLVLIPSVFEGYIDDGVITTSLRSVPHVAVLHDLIPALFADTYLGDRRMREWYEGRCSELRGAHHLLAISRTTESDARRLLGDSPPVSWISCAVDDSFFEHVSDPEGQAAAAKRMGIRGSYVLYTGGIDPRKNIHRLIEAWGLLRSDLRHSRQLVVVCRISHQEAADLRHLAKQQGLTPDDLVLTGEVSDLDLRGLYHGCDFFVFPSWYEGFGLPIVEAMSAGKAVAVADRGASVELVTEPAAQFDPHSATSIAATIERLLTDDQLRMRLEAAAPGVAAGYRWLAVAQRTIRVLHSVMPPIVASTAAMPLAERSRPLLALVSPVSPTETGIADYSGELIDALSAHYQIVVVTDDQRSGPISHGAKVVAPQWLLQHHRDVERVVYQVGNSEFHQYQFELLDRVPGVVVLHEVFLSGVIAHLEAHGRTSGHWPSSLYRAHGYAALASHPDSHVDPAAAIRRYPCTLDVMQRADSVIVHSQHALDLLIEHFGEVARTKVAVIPLLRSRRAVTAEERTAARRALGLGESEFLVCSFGLTGPGKLSPRVVEGFGASTACRKAHARLVLVGGSTHAETEARIAELIAELPDGSASCTGRVDAETFRRYLAAADLAVQLRTDSRGESSGAALDCMAAGIAVIANAHGFLDELPYGSVHRIGGDAEATELAAAIDHLLAAPTERHQIATVASEYVATTCAPALVAEQYVAAVESTAAAAGSRTAGTRMLRDLAPDLQRSDLAAAADGFTATFPPQPHQRQLLVDVSELAVRNIGTGCQRVTSEVLRRLLLAPPVGVRVEPVYASEEVGYRYARQFTQQFLDLSVPGIHDDAVEASDGDIFFALDLQPTVLTARRCDLLRMKAHGVDFHSVVHDLLPITLPWAFLPGAAELHASWLHTVLDLGSAHCVSSSGAEQLRQWAAAQGFGPDRAGVIDSFPNGCDPAPTFTPSHIPDDAEDVLDAVRATPTFLMVGTLEPRKGHAEALDAFELMWSSGFDANLFIVGRQGWMVDDLITRILSHPEHGGRLRWLGQISDVYLELLYENATALIAASYDEGFGLPVVEARHRGLPSIVRDIPVFRELADNDVTFFGGADTPSLGDVLTTAAAPSWAGRRAVATKASATWNDTVDRLITSMGLHR